MPPSQLKRLRTLLRDQGIVGPQKPKKQKEQARKNGNGRDGGAHKGAALQDIREQFNPFESIAPKKSKSEFANARIAGAKIGKVSVSRPGFSKGLGEESVRKKSPVGISTVADLST